MPASGKVSSGGQNMAAWTGALKKAVAWRSRPGTLEPLATPTRAQNLFPAPSGIPRDHSQERTGDILRSGLKAPSQGAPREAGPQWPGERSAQPTLPTLTVRRCPEPSQ